MDKQIHRFNYKPGTTVMMNDITWNGSAVAETRSQRIGGRLFDLEGRVAIVTGASGLIGTNHCRALAGAGATVIALDLDQRVCDALAEAIRIEVPDDSSATVRGMAADVTDADALRGVCRAVLNDFGRIDVLVNNAAINDMFENPTAAGELSKFENYPLELLQRSLDVNLVGTFLCAQIFGSEMARAGSGSIINVASTYGIVAPNQAIYRNADGTQNFFKSAAYPITKGGVIAFTKFLAAYWGAKNVRVNTLSPGGVENGQDEQFIRNYSDRTPLGRMALPTDYQGALLFLAGDASAYMTGANLVVDGGWTCW